MKKEILVVIPFVAEDAQGSEIRLAAEGWRKHFKSKCRIVVVGDDPGIQNIDTVLKVDRLPEVDGQYRPHLDIANKMREVINAFSGAYDGCIWASDDCYAVNDFTIADVKQPKFQDAEMPWKGELHPNPWRRNLVKTRHLCDREGLGIVNWVTHLPLYYKFDKLASIIQDYDLIHESYVIENIYFNKFRPRLVPHQMRNDDGYKFGVYYEPLDKRGFADALNRKIWVCNSAHGWSEGLESALRQHYGLE